MWIYKIEQLLTRVPRPKHRQVDSNLAPMLASPRPPRRGYFSEEDASETSSTVASSTRASSLVPRRSAPLPSAPPAEHPSPAGVVRFAREPETVVWDRECMGHSVVRAVDVAPTVVVTKACASSLRSAAREGRAQPVTARRARSNRVGLCVDLSKVPSTARHARQMIVVDTGSVTAALDGVDASAEAVAGFEETPAPAAGIVRLRYGPSPGSDVSSPRWTMRLRLEASVPRLSARCSALRETPTLRATALAAELCRDGGHDLGAFFGFVALDEARRAVVLLEDDPAAAAAPLVGCWVSGARTAGRTEACAELAVLEAVAATLVKPNLWCVDPDTLLLLLFVSRGGPAHDPIAYEATAVYSKPSDRPADRVGLDFVADLDDEADEPSKRPRALLAARLWPVPEPPPRRPDRCEPALRAEPDEPPRDLDRCEPTLQAQLHELRRRLDDLEARAARKPAGRAIATEITDTLLLPARGTTTTAQQTEVVATETVAPAPLEPPPASVEPEPAPVEPEPEPVEPPRAPQPFLVDDEAAHVEPTLDVPRIICPRDVRDILEAADGDFDRDDRRAAGPVAAPWSLGSSAHLDHYTTDDWAVPVLLNPHLDDDL